MEIHFAHHPVTLWHPAMLTAVVVPGIVAWIVSRRVTRLVMKVRPRWGQGLLLLVAVPVVAVLIALLTLLLFGLVWRKTEGPNVFVGFGYFNRFVLLVPSATVLVFAARELIRTTTRERDFNASAV
ncbi:MAG TPA: hypothetical protein VF432_10630 [Thermoanaerobaculia bacterium]